MNRQINTTGIRVFVDTGRPPPHLAVVLVYDNPVPVPLGRALMIAYERMEQIGLSTMPVRAYDMSKPVRERRIVPPPVQHRVLIW